MPARTWAAPRWTRCRTTWANKTRFGHRPAGDIPDAGTGLVLERIRDQLSASDVILLERQRPAGGSAGQSRFLLNPERPSPQQLRMVRTQRSVAVVEGLDEPGPGGRPTTPGIKVLALASPSSLGLLAEPALPAGHPGAAAHAGGQRHRGAGGQPRIPGTRALAREGLRRMYIGTLTLSLFLAVFGAVLLAVLLGNQLARPLLVLAAGVREVAAGDLSPKPALQGRTSWAA